MTKIFFATARDVEQIWRWLFDAPGMAIFEDNSLPDRANRWFDKWEEISRYLAQGGYNLAAWPRNVGGQPEVRKIVFNPELRRELGGKGRSMLQTPASITINRNNDQNGCVASASLSFWTEKGARERSICSTDLIDEVDWAAFRSITRRLQGQIAKAAPAKMHSYPIMPDAFEQLTANQIRLWNWGEPISYPSNIITSR